MSIIVNRYETSKWSTSMASYCQRWVFSRCAQRYLLDCVALSRLMRHIDRCERFRWCACSARSISVSDGIAFSSSYFCDACDSWLTWKSAISFSLPMSISNEASSTFSSLSLKIIPNRTGHLIAYIGTFCTSRKMFSVCRLQGTSCLESIANTSSRPWTPLHLGDRSWAAHATCVEIYWLREDQIWKQ